MTQKKKRDKMTVSIRRMTMTRIMDSDIRDRLERVSPCKGRTACTARLGRNIQAVRREVAAGRMRYGAFVVALDHWEVVLRSSINKKLIYEVPQSNKRTKR
jgi:hypothetical protein